MAQAIQRNRRDDNAADDHFLNPLRPAHLLPAHVEDRDDECADERAEDRAFASAEARAANDSSPSSLMKCVKH